jgi:hypothetical protein
MESMASPNRTVLLLRVALAVGSSAGALLGAGCSSSVIDSIPAWAGGEAPGTPERPAVAAEYPPVNDRPPSRELQLITEQEQARIEKELTAARANQVTQSEAVRKDREEMLANSPLSPAQQTGKPKPPSAN